MNFYIVYHFVQSCLKHITTLKILCVERSLLTQRTGDNDKGRKYILICLINIRRRTRLRWGNRRVWAASLIRKLTSTSRCRALGYQRSTLKLISMLMWTSTCLEYETNQDGLENNFLKLYNNILNLFSKLLINIIVIFCFIILISIKLKEGIILKKKYGIMYFQIDTFPFGRYQFFYFDRWIIPMRQTADSDYKESKVCFHSDDDEWTPDHETMQVSYIRNYKKKKIFYKMSGN